MRGKSMQHRNFMKDKGYIKSLIKQVPSIILLLLLLMGNIFADSSFLIQDIEFQGLQRITPGTALSYLPVKAGDTLNSTDTANIIQSLYRTGFFQNISLSRKNNTLIINVQERPTISSIKITGNKIIPTKQLTDALVNLGLAEGKTFNQSLLEEVKQSLLQQYYSQGYYSASVDTTITQASQNRVAIAIEITEGEIAKIKKIEIIGNQAFAEKKLLKQFDLTPPTLFSFFTDSDKYSKEKLDADLQRLKTFYLDNGYVKFQVNSAQVSITPDKKDVYIVVRITEGAQYTFSGYQLTGNLIIPRAELNELVKIKPGMIFSRQKVVEAEQAIGQKLGDLGYLFVLVRPIPEIDDAKKQVAVTFDIEPGQRVYIHQINFLGNTKTSDEVLRQAMRQFEGGVASLSNIKESERQLKLLPYLQDINVKTDVVSGSPDQVDVNYNLKERESAELSLSLGISDTYGLLYGAGINQSNFLGTGKQVGINFSKDEYERNISLSYNNPYYTKDGIQRGFNVYSQAFEPGAVNIADYSTEQNGIQMHYDIPVSENSSMHFGGGYQHLTVNQGDDPSWQVEDYLATNGDVFNQILLSAGWGFNGYDQIIFPTKGFNQSVNATVSLPVSNQPLEYWQAGYQAHLYQPLTPSRNFILSLRGEFNYGQSYGKTQGFPFFENYYAGGIGTVRGFEGNTLGPQDSQGNALGGSTLLDGTAEIILPQISENLRTSAFIDMGNVFEGTVVANQLRYSAGVAIIWRVPMLGPMEFSLAYPLNKRSGDNIEPFQFNIGTTF